MAKEKKQKSDDGDVIRFEGLEKTRNVAGGIGIAALVVSYLLGMSQGDAQKTFLFSYLVAFMSVLAAALGVLWFVTLQHLTNSSWSVVVRRVGELLAGALPALGVLSLPIVVPMLMGNASMYVWVDHELMEKSHQLHSKVAYLNMTFFVVRCVVYFGFWTLLSRFFLRTSLQQDQTGDATLSQKMQKVAAPAMIVFALTLTFCVIDFVMTLDATWFSTIFGVYYFAGAVMSGYALLALTVMWLQKNGRLLKSVTVEHFHDIGKMMFAFGTVFWSYIAFSQFMLIWYADMPEETHWYKIRFAGEWGNVSAALLIGHFLLPFLGLISRAVKRNRTGLMFWAVWMLGIEYVDLYWLIKPELHTAHVPLHPLDVTCLVAVVALFLAAVAHMAKSVNLIPTKDPRLQKSLAFENY